MKRPTMLAIVAAPMLVAVAASAMAQPTATLEIDFTNVALPLSPWLTALIAVALCAWGVYAQRRMRGRARHATWMVLGIVAASLAAMLANVQPLGSAQANPFILVSLGSSPATVAVTNPGGFEVTNTTSGPITLVAVQLNNPGPFVINPHTTCVAGLALASGAACVIFVTEM